MAVTTITFTLAGEDKDLSVQETNEIIQSAFDGTERNGKTLKITIGYPGMVLEITPDTFQVSRLGREDKPQAVVTVSHNGRKAKVYIQREQDGWYWATTTKQNADQGYTLKANGEAFKETYRDGEKLGSVKVGTWALA